MKKICIISDSHGRTSFVERILSDTTYDSIYFLGDGERDFENIYDDRLVMIAGNCDLYSPYPLEKIEVVNGVRILLTHGHIYNVKYSLLSLICRAREVKADIVCYGHTHQQEGQKDDILILNPGSLSSGRYIELFIEDDGTFRYELKQF